MKNTILAVLAVALFAVALRAQPVAESKQFYNTVKNNFTRMAEKMPADDYAFKPVPEIRSFGETIAHLADSQMRMCAQVVGEQKTVDAASKKTKDELVAALKASFEECDKAWDSVTPENAAEPPQGARRSRLGTLIYNLNHENEEYGYLAVYMRLKGVVPPSSDRSMAPAQKK